MKFHIITPWVEQGDAVSRDFLAMHEALQAAGFDSQLYAENIAPELKKEVCPLSSYEHAGITNSADTLIYHHSIQWGRGKELYSQTRNRRIIKYHNVTPPHYFSPYSERFASICQHGRKQTSDLVAKGADLYLADSLFNVQELIDAGASPERCHVLPPFHRIEALSNVNASVTELEQFSDGQFNIVFVGRFVPNKCHLNLLRTFACFHADIEPRSRLILVGKTHPELSRYVDEIRRNTQQLALSDSVVIMENASGEQLRAVYLTAHIFLCLSEHEGFCVPLVEAMFHRIPIVALRRTGVPETLGPTALLADKADEMLLGEMIAYCLENKTVSRWLTDAQYERFLRCFSSGTITDRFVSLVSL